jgi:hypothetical protein
VRHSRELYAGRTLGANPLSGGSGAPEAGGRKQCRESGDVHRLFDSASPECGYVKIRLFIVRALYVLHHKNLLIHAKKSYGTAVEPSQQLYRTFSTDRT